MTPGGSPGGSRPADSRARTPGGGSGGAEAGDPGREPRRVTAGGFPGEDTGREWTRTPAGLRRVTPRKEPGRAHTAAPARTPARADRNIGRAGTGDPWTGTRQGRGECGRGQKPRRGSHARLPGKQPGARTGTPTGRGRAIPGREPRQDEGGCPGPRLRRVTHGGLPGKDLGASGPRTPAGRRRVPPGRNPCEADTAGSQASNPARGDHEPRQAGGGRSRAGNPDRTEAGDPRPGTPAGHGRAIRGRETPARHPPRLPGRRLPRARQRVTSTLVGRDGSVLRCVALGMGTAQIAAQLFVSPSTVRKHLENAFGRLGVSSRTAAVARVFPEPEAL
ncbi:response regulator transcription factor [Streptomyces canus]|uniref:helix-turn-helix transcriptional regulator n=1 Tax=Streptomyces canus TaxID=58343 RepID=UPI0036B44FC5